MTNKITGLTPRKRVRKIQQHPQDWVVEEHVTINGRHVTPGTMLSFQGQRGRFRFVHKVTTPVATWLDVVGPEANPRSRSFVIADVKTVHRSS